MPFLHRGSVHLGRKYIPAIKPFNESRRVRLPKNARLRIGEINSSNGRIKNIFWIIAFLPDEIKSSRKDLSFKSATVSNSTRDVESLLLGDFGQAATGLEWRA